MGYTVNYGAGIRAEFTSTPLAAPLTVGGSLGLKFYLVDPVRPVWLATSNPRLSVEVDAIDAIGDLFLAIAALQIPPVTLPAGSRISVFVWETATVTSASRTVYGGTALTANYSDAGVTFTTGSLQ